MPSLGFEPRPPAPKAGMISISLRGPYTKLLKVLSGSTKFLIGISYRAPFDFIKIIEKNQFLS